MRDWIVICSRHNRVVVDLKVGCYHGVTSLFRVKGGWFNCFRLVSCAFCKRKRTISSSTTTISSLYLRSGSRANVSQWNLNSANENPWKIWWCSWTSFGSIKLFTFPSRNKRSRHCCSSPSNLHCFIFMAFLHPKCVILKWIVNRYAHVVRSLIKTSDEWRHNRFLSILFLNESDNSNTRTN